MYKYIWFYKNLLNLYIFYRTLSKINNIITTVVILWWTYFNNKNKRIIGDNILTKKESLQNLFLFIVFKIFL